MSFQESVTTTNTPTTWEESPENYAELKKKIPSGYTLYESFYTTFLKWQNCRDEEQTSGCQGNGGWGQGWGGSRGGPGGGWRCWRWFCILAVVAVTHIYTWDTMMVSCVPPQHTSVQCWREGAGALYLCNFLLICNYCKGKKKQKSQVQPGILDWALQQEQEHYWNK